MTTQEKEIKVELKIPLSEFVRKAKLAGFSEIEKIVQTDTYFDTPDWHLYNTVASVRIRMVNNKDHSFAFKKVFHLPNRNDPFFVEEIEGNLPSTDIRTFNTILERLSIKPIEGILDLRKTSHRPDRFSTESEAVLSERGEPIGSSNEEKQVLDGGGVLGDAGILRESSKELNSDSITKILKGYGLQDEQVMTKTRRILVDDRDNEIVIDEIKGILRVVEVESKTDDPVKVIDTILKQDEWSRSVAGTGYIWLEKKKGFKRHNDYPDMFKKKSDWNVWDNERDLYDDLLVGSSES